MVGVLTAIVVLSLNTKPQIDKLLPLSVSVASTAVGFLAGAISILIAVKDSTVVRILRRDGHIKILVAYFRTAITATIGLIVFSVILIAFTFPWGNYVAVFWLGLGAFSAAASFRIVWLLMGILRSYLGED